MPNNAWDLPLTQRLLFKKLTAGHNEALTSLMSVVDRMDHARYHYHQVKTPWAHTLRDAVETDKRWRILGWDATDEERELQSRESIERSANIVACIHALHAVPDTLAFALFYCLEMVLPGKKTMASVDVVSMKEWLATHSQGGSFSDILVELTAPDSYKHLEALSNHAKHRSIIRDKMSADVTGTNPLPLRLRLAAFSYKDSKFSQVDALPFIQGEFDRISPLVIKCGRLINQYLADRSDWPGAGQ